MKGLVCGLPDAENKQNNPMTGQNKQNYVVTPLAVFRSRSLRLVTHGTGPVAWVTTTAQTGSGPVFTTATTWLSMTLGRSGNPVRQYWRNHTVIQNGGVPAVCMDCKANSERGESSVYKYLFAASGVNN